MGRIISDINEIRAKEQSLTVVKVDHEKWIVCYEDKSTSEKWIKEYADSTQQGESLQLRQVEHF